MATRTIANAGGNWSATGTWVEGAAPTASDDVVATATSGSLTIDVAASARSIDLTNYVATFTHNAFTVTLGTTTANPSGVSLKFVAGMTYVGNTTRGFAFQSTAATTETVTLAGKTVWGLTLSLGTTSTIKFLDTSNVGLGSGITQGFVSHLSGTLDLNAQTHNWVGYASNSSTTRKLFDSVGGSILNLSSNSTNGGTAPLSWDNGSTITNGTWTLSNVTLNLTGSGFALRNSSVTFGTVNVTSLTAVGIVYASTYANLNVTGGAGRNANLQFLNSSTITGTFSVTSNSAISRVFVTSNVPGTQFTVQLGAAGTFSPTDVDFADLKFTGTNTPIVGTRLGDLGGNGTGITFTTAVTRYWVGGTGNWSDTTHWSASSGGTGGATAPLPQDTVVFDVNSGGGTVTPNIAWLGKDISFTGWTGGLGSGGIAVGIFGSLTMSSTMLSTGTGNGISWNLRGRSSHTLTTAGYAWPLGMTVTVFSVGGTYTFVDNFSTVAVSGLNLNNGTLDAATNNVNVTVPNFTVAAQTGAVARTLLMGNGTWSMTRAGGGTWWNIVNGAGLTLTCANSTLVFTGGGAIIFSAAGFTYWGVVYNGTGATGSLTINHGTNIKNITFSGQGANPRTLTLQASNTFAFGGTVSINGSAGNLVTLNSTTPGTQATVSATNPQFLSYVALTDIAATGGPWLYDSNSTASNISGWSLAIAAALLASSALSATDQAAVVLVASLVSAATASAVNSQQVALRVDLAAAAMVTGNAGDVAQIAGVIAASMIISGFGDPRVRTSGGIVTPSRIITVMAAPRRPVNVSAAKRQTNIVVPKIFIPTGSR